MWAEQGPSQMYALPAGWNNPAGLDLRPQAIVMDLAAERALFYYQTGNPDFANKALEDLNKWRNAPGFFDKVSFEDTAIMLSLSPLFAMGRYKDVVESYEQAGSRMNRLEQSNKFGRTFSNVLWLGLPSLLNKLTSPDDTRLFEVSLEDASHALLYSISLDKIGKRELSKKALDEILAVQESHDMGGIYWLILYERGQISLEEGKRQEAIEYFREAADAIELVRNNVEFEANKIGLATRTQAVYEALVSVLADEGNWKDAFLATERAKGRALVDLLAQVREFAPPRQTGGRADVGQLLTAAATNTRDSGLTGDSRNVETRGAVVSARRELGAISPETASLVSVRTKLFDAIVARIAPEETLIAYFQAGDRLYGFVVSRLGTKGFLLAADGMHSEVRDFREAIENESEASRHIGETLYNRLIRPLEHEIRGGGALTISPHLILHYVPFAALFDGRQYLIDRYSLQITPSASALAYFAATGQGRQRRVLALGNPDLGDPRFDLPGAQKEAVAVAHLFPGSRALVRAEATKTAIIEMGGDFPMLHFASHGTFASDAPLTSGLLLARGQEPDGRLAVSDLYKLHLDADLVTLSGCETGLATIAGGDDLIGLTRGFFHAGARTVVASLWEVPDASTEKLMLSFYRNLGGLDKREALRHAAIETREIYPAPRHWAAFFLTGSAD